VVDFPVKGAIEKSGYTTIKKPPPTKTKKGCWGGDIAKKMTFNQSKLC
jgi:hypothetical protein